MNLGKLKNVVFAQELLTDEDINLYERWAVEEYEKDKAAYANDEASSVGWKRSKSYYKTLNGQSKEELKERDQQPNKFIFVADGVVINAVKGEGPKSSLTRRFQSYKMNIVAADNIDNFLYCLCTNHNKMSRDNIPLGLSEGGVYVYALEQML